MARKPTKHRPSGTDPGRMSGQGELRIIGGDWRSRKLRFPDAGGVRPTPARTRETLFNWLNFHLAGARCLDLFAGSGVLGLEALSRGADSATLVDHTPGRWPRHCGTISDSSAPAVPRWSVRMWPRFWPSAGNRPSTSSSWTLRFARAGWND